MTSKDKELEILKAYYEKRYNNAKMDVPSLGMEDTHESAFHLANLERDGQLVFEKNIFHEGGRRDEKYNNAVLAIWWNDAHITDKGEKRLKEAEII